MSRTIYGAPAAASSGASATCPRGLNITGLEGNNLDGTLAFGTGAQSPNPQATYDNAAARGHRIARIPFLWERVQPTVGGALSSASMTLLQAEVTRAAKAGMVVVLDLKNYGRRFINSGDASQVRLGEGVLTSASFADLWSRLATAFADQPAVVAYGLMNEPHDLPVAPPSGGPSPANTTWKVFSQAAATAIRATGDTREIWVHGDEFSGGWNWANYNGAPWITDPLGKVRYVCHFYFNQTRSGIYDGTPYATEEATAGISLLTRAKADAANFLGWLKTNGVKGAIGEIGWPNTYDATSWNAVGEAMYQLFNDAGIPVLYWGTGANLVGGPDGRYNQDPYPPALGYAPQAEVAVIEKPANLSQPNPLGSALTVEQAPNIRPKGVWDFTLAPTVGGVTIGGSSVPEYAIQSGSYWTPSSSTTGTGALTAGMINIVALTPMYIPAPMTVSEIVLDVSTVGTAGAVLRAGFYGIDAYGLPNLGNLRGETPAVATTGSAGLRTLVPSATLTLAKGTVWFGVVAQVAGCTLRTAVGGNGASLPFPLGQAPVSVSSVPILCLEVGNASTTFPTSGTVGRGTITNFGPPKVYLKAA